ncbi:MAG: hypothetical protein JNN15_15795, partial [Blastocatellia bacterium]|nr:hypothetical protein [Blastocatellia bacterium]
VAAVCAVIIVFAAIASIGGYYIWNRLKKPVPVVKTPDPVTTPKKDTPVVVPPAIPEAPPNMVLIPAGEYLIGTDQGDET